MIYFDKFSEIGSSHKENEDFAVIGDEENPFIIVSDGCSSSKNTSTGSRLLSLCAAEELRNNPLEVASVGINSIYKASILRSSLGINKESLDVTLMIAYMREGVINVSVWGDGFIYVKKLSEDYFVTELSYSPEIPYYLSYKIDGSRDFLYCRPYGSIIKTENDSEVPVKNASHWRMRADGIEYIMLSTDGVSSFQKDNVDIPQEEINKQITAFKRLNGEFIGRRMKRMMKNNAKDGVRHYDDLTIAGMSFVD